MQLPVGAGRSARGCKRTGNEVGGVLGEMVVFRVVDVVVLVSKVGGVNDDNDDDEAEGMDAENPWRIKKEANMVIMMISERISSSVPLLGFTGSGRKYEFMSDEYINGLIFVFGCKEVLRLPG